MHAFQGLQQLSGTALEPQKKKHFISHRVVANSGFQDFQAVDGSLVANLGGPYKVLEGLAWSLRAL